MKKIKAAGFVCLFAVVLVWAVKSGASASATDELSIGQKIDVEFASYIAENEDMRTRDIDQYFSANGNIQQLAKQMDTDSIYAIGDNIIIANDEIEQYEKFYELQGNSAPEEIAIAYAEKRNALYVAAIMNGFSVTDVEIYAVCKILLESRALKKTEMDAILTKLLLCCDADSGRKQVKELIPNEAYHYIELQHKKPLLDTIWQLAGAIREQRYLEVKYVKMSKEKVVRIIRPAGIMFSEFYFYLVGFLDDKEIREKFDNPEDPFPTIYRIDRMESVKVLNRKFQILYKDRFEEGEFRKRIQFMYGGNLRRVRFQYHGDNLEFIMDRLPTARISNENKGGYIVEAEVFGKGIDIWLKSQGNMVEVL